MISLTHLQESLISLLLSPFWRLRQPRSHDEKTSSQRRLAVLYH